MSSMRRHAKKRELSRESVSTQTLQNLTRWGMKWKDGVQLGDFPQVGDIITILRHKWPRARVSMQDFIKMHQQRVALQKKIAEARSQNPALEGVQALGLPILAGFDVIRNEFVTVLQCPRYSKPFPKKPGHIEYAALERSLCKVWSFGFQLSTLDLSKVLISPSYDVFIYDCSTLIGRARWLGEQYSKVVPGSTQVRFESLYAPGGDATLLLQLYGQLPPTESPDDRDKLVDTARTQLWKKRAMRGNNMLV